MKSQCKTLTRLGRLLAPDCGDRLEEVLRTAEDRWRQLCAENKADPKAVRRHTEGAIFPAIALLEGLLRAGFDRSAAVSLLDRVHCQDAEKPAAMYRRLMKLPGAYRLMPRIFETVARQQFGVKAGFAATFYDEGPRRCRFDMTRCLYCDVCRRYDCPDLVKCFCHQDDVTDGHMHPRLRWARTKTMGEGGDCCDFDLIAEDK